jgi:hypothetical protein
MGVETTEDCSVLILWVPHTSALESRRWLQKSAKSLEQSHDNVLFWSGWQFYSNGHDLGTIRTTGLSLLKSPFPKDTEFRNSWRKFYIGTHGS